MLDSVSHCFPVGPDGRELTRVILQTTASQLPLALSRALDRESGNLGFSPSSATNYPWKLGAGVLSFLDLVSVCKIRRLNQTFSKLPATLQMPTLCQSDRRSSYSSPWSQPNFQWYTCIALGMGVRAHSAWIQCLLQRDYTPVSNLICIPGTESQSGVYHRHVASP